MSSHGWSITYPHQVVAFGARALVVPGRGNALCASVIMPFRLDGGDLVPPADWYEHVRAFGGDVTPDAVAPLPRAELLLLGGVEPVVDDARDCAIRCGSVEVNLVLHPSSDADGPPALGPEDAVWHERDNPVGRGGPEDQRRPLIVDRDRPSAPVWLGPTSYLHAARQRHLGVPGEASTGGWPSDARGDALHDAHEAFWADGLFPGDPLRLAGMVAEPIDLDLPPYRVDMAICRATEGEPVTEWFPMESRVHSVAVIPRAGIGAMFWRASVDLGEDIMGETVVALVAGVADANAPVRDHEELADIAAERWVAPERGMDNRPLLPPSLHDRVDVPFGAPPEGEAFGARVAAAEEWALGELGIDENPFDGQGDAEELTQMAQAALPSSEVMEGDQMREVVDAVLARSKKRHEEMGFGEEARPGPPEAVERGEGLPAEIDCRLTAPYQSQQEMTIAENLSRHPTGVDAGETLERLAGVRIQSPDPPMLWDPFVLHEAVQLGEAVLGRLQDGDLSRHVDVSGAQVGDAPDEDPRLRPEPDDAELGMYDGSPLPPLPRSGGGRDHSVRNRRLDGLLAEETGWRGVVFERCEFVDMSFARSEIENCEFVECTFERVNVAGAVFAECRFVECALTGLEAVETAWRACVFEDCRLEHSAVRESAMRDVTFEDGLWRDVTWEEGIVLDLRMIGVAFEDVTFTMIRSGHVLFERVSMHRVTALARGFPFATFRDSDIRHCGFIGCHFDETVWENVRVEEVGLTNGIFTEAKIGADCEFRRCDFTGAAFMKTTMAGARLVECTMAQSQWSGCDATGTWFFGSNLRGVHFADARLARAVFCDADLNGTVFQEHEVIGADFTGTTRGVA